MKDLEIVYTSDEAKVSIKSVRLAKETQIRYRRKF